MKTIILVGTSQSGKSTLANYLLNGRLDREKNKFGIGKGQNSKTREPQKETVEWTYKKIIDTIPAEELVDVALLKDLSEKEQEIKLKDIKQGIKKKHGKEETDKIQIIDTGGTNDTDDVSEIRNMLSLFKLLADAKEISCVVLVVKQSTLFNTKHKENLKFYQDLFKKIFDLNLVIVLTAFSLSEAKVEEEMTGNKAEDVLDEARTNLEKIYELGRDVPILPVNLLSQTQGGKVEAIATRELIFSRCFEIPGLAVSGLQYPKPGPWREQDKIRVGKLEETIKGIMEGLIIAKKDLEQIFALVYQHAKIIHENKLKVEEKTRELKSMNTEDDVVFKDEHFIDPGAWFWWVSKPFNYSDLPHPISRVSWTRGNPQYTEQQQTSLKGTVTSNWFCALNATLTIYTTKQHYYQQDIARLQGELSMLNESIVQNDSQYQAALELSNAKKVVIAETEARFTALMTECESLQKQTITIQQFEERLKNEELRNSGN